MLSRSTYEWSLLSAEGRGPSSGPQSVVARNDDLFFVTCHTPLQMHDSIVRNFKPFKVHLSCVYENSLEKSTLYKHSGPLDLGT